MAYATFWTFFMTHFTSPYGHISTQCSDVEIQVETTSQGNSSRVTKASGLGYTYASVKRSAALDRGKYRYTF